MHVLMIVVCATIACVLIASWLKRRKENRDLELHSITPEALHTLLSDSNHEILLFDVRRPLDLLTHLEAVPGSTWISPNELLQNPSLIAKDKETVVYCTCPGDATSRSIVHKALRMRFSRIKLLKGGLAAWKAHGYSVVKYDKPFHLDTLT